MQRIQVSQPWMMWRLLAPLDRPAAIVLDACVRIRIRGGGGEYVRVVGKGDGGGCDGGVCPQMHTCAQMGGVEHGGWGSEGYQPRTLLE